MLVMGSIFFRVGLAWFCVAHAVRGIAWESLGISTLIPIKEYYKHMGS